MDTKKQGGVNIQAFAIFAPYLLLRFYKFATQFARSKLVQIHFSRPLKGNKTKSTLGIRVIPPTSKTSPMSLLLISASRRHFLHGSIVRCTRSATRDSNLARVSFMAKCFGPLASTVIYGKLMSVYRSKTEVHLVHYPFVILLYFSLQLSKQSSDHKLLKINYYCI